MVTRKDLGRAMNARVVGPADPEAATTIVLAHGYGGDQSVWDKIVPLLSERYRLVLFDWCFAGAISDPNLYDAQTYSRYDAFADDLISLMDELKLDSSSSSSRSVVFVGHSMSGTIGCIASVKRPDIFRKLVLVGPSPRLVNLEDYTGGFELPDIEQLLSSIEHDYEQWVSGFASSVVDPSDPSSALKFAGCLKRMRPEVALSLAKTVFLADYRDVLERVETPCEIMHTRKDVIVPDSVVAYMQGRIKGRCGVRVIDTEGHFPQLTNHVQFVEVLVGILSAS